MRLAFLLAFDRDSPYQWSLPPLGIGYLSSYAKKRSWQLETSFFIRVEDLIRERPDVAAISSSTENFSQAVRDAQRIKEELAIPIILGGMHITSLPHRLPREFDVGCIGEGEETFVDLVKLYYVTKRPAASEFAKIPGIVYHPDGGANGKTGGMAAADSKNIPSPVFSGDRELIKPLDSLPYPDREMLGRGWGVEPGEVIHLITSRGCPYHCAFCSSAKHWKGFRFFSADYVAREVEFLRSRYNPEIIYFFDDLFIGHAGRWREVVRLFRERGLHRGVRFRAYARADLITDEMADEFSELNFKYIDFGFESNSPRVLNYLCKTHVTPEINQLAVDRLVRTRISLGANFIIGSPPETLEDAQATYQFAWKNRDAFDRCSVGPLQPLPGTSVWNEAAAKGIVNDDMEWSRLGVSYESFDFERFPYLGESMSREEFRSLFDRFHQLEKDINYVGQIRRLVDQKTLREHQVRSLEQELAELKGSRILRAALALRRWRQTFQDRPSSSEHSSPEASGLSHSSIRDGGAS